MERHTRDGPSPIFWAVVLRFIGLLAGCGGSGFDLVTQAEPSLTSLSLDPPNATVAVGSRQPYVVTGIYSDGTKKTLSASAVAWESSNTSAATVSGATPGIVSAMNVGNTTIKVSLGGVSAVAVLNVSAATLLSIEVTPTNATVPLGLSVAFKATGVYSDHSLQDLTAAVTWSSSATGVAAVSGPADANGLVVGRALGAALISATHGGITGSTPLTITAATLVSIELTSASDQLPLGLTESVSATGLFSDGTIRDVTGSVVWSSATPSVATISAAGLFRAVAAGSTTVTATLGGISSQKSMTVTAATLLSIGVTPAQANIPKGTQVQMTAVGTYSDGSAQVITHQAVWTSSDTAVGTVQNASSSSGLVTALATGATTVTATFSGVAGATTLTVTSAALESIEVTPSQSNIVAGTTQAMTATGIFTDGTTANLTQEVTWSSSATSAAAIDNAAGSHGIVAALGAGATIITATMGGLSGSTPLTVSAATLVSIAVAPANASIALGTHQSFTALGIYTDNSTHDVTSVVAWSSAPTTVAGVDNAAGTHGQATGLGLGSATITATLGSVSGSGALQVTAATLVSISVAPTDSSLALGTQEALKATATYTDQTTQDVTQSAVWTSSTPAVATISNAPGTQGLTAASSLGSTNISAAVGGISGVAALTVTPALLVSIAVSSASNTVFVGNLQPYTAMGTYSDGTSQDITAGASTIWTSSAGTVATESNAGGSQGVLTPLMNGSTTVTATAGGVSGAAAVTVLKREYAYVANGSSITPYVVGNDGVLSALGSGPVSTGYNSVLVYFAADSVAESLYVTDIVNSQMNEYSIAPDGALTQVATYATGAAPFAVVVDPSNRFLYQSGPGSGVLNEYSIAASGALTPIGSTSTSLTMPFAMVSDPTDRFLYVADAGTLQLVEYSIAGDGTLTYAGDVATAYTPEGMVIDPTGQYLYASTQNGASSPGEVLEYTIDPNTGALTPIGSISGGNYCRSIVMDQTGSYVYVANVFSDSISAYQVGADGTLSLLATIATDGTAQDLNTEPSGRFLYAPVVALNEVMVFQIGTDGSLNLIDRTSTGQGAYAVQVVN